MRNVIMFLCIITVNCISNTVVWQFQNEDSFSLVEKESLLKLIKKVPDFDKPYEITVGIIDKYGLNKAAIAKQIVRVNDTLLLEKWLYLWKREWTDSGVFRRFGDSTIQNRTFVTGPKCITKVEKYIYKHDRREKIFQFTASKGSYNDVKQILDCVLNETAILDSMIFKEETKETWKMVKENVLEFKSVMKWVKDYDFHYDIPKFKPSELQLIARLVGNTCLIYYAGPRGAGD